MRPHPKYSRTDSTAPRAWATCERCGFIWNLVSLQWQFDWRGMRLENTRHLVCPKCLDEPQRQLGSIILPPDPVGVINSRPEQYGVEEIPVSTFYTQDGRILITNGVGQVNPSSLIATGNSQYNGSP